MKKIIPFLILVFLITATLISSCKKDSPRDPVPDDENEIPNSFEYATTKNLNVSLRLISNNDKPIPGAVVSIADPKNPERVFLKAVSDAQGFVNSTIVVPSYMDTLLATPIMSAWSITSSSLRSSPA
jgi:hypothetical protein